MNHLVNHVELESQTLIYSTLDPQKTPPIISFTQFDMFKAPNSPLYITTRVTNIPFRGILVDPSSVMNVITKENLFNK